MTPRGVSPGVQARALHDRSLTPCLLCCHPRRHAGKSSSQVYSPPWVVLEAMPSSFGIIDLLSFVAAPIVPLFSFSAILSLSPRPTTRPSGVFSSATLAISPLSAGFALCTPPPALPPRPAIESSELPSDLGFCPVLVSSPFSSLAVRASLPYPLDWLRLPLATDPPPASLLRVGTATPGVINTASYAVRGVPGCPIAVVSLLAAFWWHSVARGAGVLAQASLSVSCRSPAPAPFLYAKTPRPSEREAARHIPQRPVPFEPRGFIVLNVPSAR